MGVEGGGVGLQGRVRDRSKATVPGNHMQPRQDRAARKAPRWGQDASVITTWGV
jgi:hypothetical protein